MTESFQRYLRAKRTVDDRALDRGLIDTLREQLSDRAAGTDGPIRVLEAGAGIGTMLTRFIEWDVLPAGDVRYTAVDIESEHVATIPNYLREWGADSEGVVIEDGLTVATGDRCIEIETVAADAVDYASDAAGYDLLVGAALLDIIDRDALPALLSALAGGGHYYFPITFDGATRFHPSHPADKAVESRYHDHMDQKPGGNSRAGGAILTRLHRLDGATLSAVAGSDWVVRPANGTYPADEAYFLRYILDTVENAVREVADDDFDAVDDWLARRREQVATAELLYCTHQLDFLGRITAPTAFDS